MTRNMSSIDFKHRHFEISFTLQNLEQSVLDFLITDYRDL